MSVIGVRESKRNNRAAFFDKCPHNFESLFLFVRFWIFKKSQNICMDLSLNLFSFFCLQFIVNLTIYFFGQKFWVIIWLLHISKKWH